MTPRDEKGRFVRADAKPVLHRQVECDATEWTEEQLESIPRRTVNQAREIWVDGKRVKHDGSEDPAKWADVAARSSGIWIRDGANQWRHGDIGAWQREHLEWLGVIKPKPDPHGPRLDAWLVVLIAVALLAATVLAIAAAAYDGGVL